MIAESKCLFGCGGRATLEPSVERECKRNVFGSEYVITVKIIDCDSRDKRNASFSGVDIDN